ncbi:ATP-binding protein [uncultured Tateyamaria sp.]|uniref:ATP-binding protein n=1 Tax=uncultured Tateyamaria sp. TaxID=455651 RepID=UPI00262888F8|nr:ATP-binding protein [uncultured Tateyamaria sp.]
MLSQGSQSIPPPQFAAQIDLLRKLEPPTSFLFLFQVFLVLGACFSAYALAGWLICAAWGIVYVALLLSEKLVVRLVPAAPTLRVYASVLVLLTLQASFYCFLPVYLWFLGPDVAKFGSLALITGSTVHTMLNRATYPSILLCFLIPDAAVFLIISAHALLMFGASTDAFLYLIGGLAICAYFGVAFLQAYQRDTRARRETEERKVAQAAREASEIRFQSLFDSAPIPIREEDLSGVKRLVDSLGIADPEALSHYLDAHPEFVQACGREIVVVNANQASLEEHGYANKQELLDRVVATLSEDAMKIVRLTIEAIHRGSHGEAFETRIRRADGQILTVAAKWSVIPGHEDTYARILLCSLDMTEHRKSEDALRQAQKMEAVGQLTGGVAHDFNNMLTVIGGNIDLMAHATEFDPDLAVPIKKAVARGAELTQRLLAFSRKQPLTARPVHLDALVLDVCDLLSRSLGEEIDIVTQLEADQWLALADAGQVEASLLNLALNARDAMPNGGTLTIATAKTTIASEGDLGLGPGDYVVLKVSDTGTGMSAETLAHAYEPFFTTKDVGKGSGLGLPSVYGFAKQSGGEVEIESALGTGTTVSLYLPRAKEVEAARPTPASVTHQLDGAGTTVLILEDDANVSAYLERLTRSQGFAVLTAQNAAEAQRVVAQGGRIDLLISDVMLPGGVRGPGFAAQLLAASPDTAVVFISGRPSEAHLEAHPDLAAETVLQKPFDRDQLLHKIETALRQRSS